MDYQAVVNYIQQCQARGMTELEIRQELAKSGWSTDVINQAFGHEDPSGVLPAPVLDGTAAPSRRSHRAAIAIVLTLLVLGLIGGGAYWYASKMSKKDTGKTAKSSDTAKHDQKTTPKLTQQESDLAALKTGVTQFAIRNDGVLPGTVGVSNDGLLALCGDICDEKATSVKLQYYQVPKVTIVLYDATLTAPDAATAYIVANASCKADHSGLGTESTGTQPTAAILYATGTGSSLKHLCTTL